ncbi:MAG: metallophosphoesterase family protein [Lentisphaerae bacterium]|nr:metallophosphoesterase family protein [Lentisphaerota bacterium]
MPKYAVLSDIHGNLEAFEAVLGVCSSMNVDKFILLGDIVGYNADPVRCIELARSLDVVAAVRGNHDDYAINYDPDNRAGFNPHAHLAIQWTHDQLSDSDREWLNSLEYSKQILKIKLTIVHATLDTPERWGYIFKADDCVSHFMEQKTLLSFCGHSHVPVAFVRLPDRSTVELIPEWGGGIFDEDMDVDFSVIDSVTVQMKTMHNYLFNIGSIGQPRNGDPRASFAIYDSDELTVTRMMVPYDIAAAKQKVLDAGLPERLAIRLGIGH